MGVYVTDPTWVSCNLAIFVCERCACIHQNLGSHISNVKSIKAEDWSHEQLQVRVLFLFYAVVTCEIKLFQNYLSLMVFCFVS